MSCKTENIVMEKSGQHFLFDLQHAEDPRIHRRDVRVSLKTTDSGEGDGDGEDEKTPGELGCIDFVAGGWNVATAGRERYQARARCWKNRPQELADGYTSEFFFAATDENGQDAVVFHCPVQGFKTGNTTYARSEMREMLDPKDKTVDLDLAGHPYPCGRAEGHPCTGQRQGDHLPRSTASSRTVTTPIPLGEGAVRRPYDKRPRGTGSAVLRV